MSITTPAYVKILAGLFTREESGAPTTASVGAVGDVWLDNSPVSLTYGKTWECTAILAGPVSYTWTAVTRDDAKITISIGRAEKDYLSIRGIPFEYEIDGITVKYPEGAEHIAAEMTCYICGYYPYTGRGEKSISEGGVSNTHDDKVRGYPQSIVSCIDRYQSVV